MRRRTCPPSSAERWGPCPRSIALAEEVEDDGPDKSWHSVRGDVLHLAASNALPKWVELGHGWDVGKAPAALDLAWDALQDAWHFHRANARLFSYRAGEKDHEALTHALCMVVELIGDLDDLAALNLERVYPPPRWLPMTKGPTVDVTFVRRDGSWGIVDYKFGRKVVPSDAPQLLIYADAVFECVPDLGFLELAVVQPPNRPHPVAVTREQVRKRLDGFKFAAVEVQLLGASSNPEDYHAGSWCHFCPAASICPLKKAARRAKVREGFAHLFTHLDEGNNLDG